MSRRASLLAKQEKRKPRVRFPDELVFLDNIKDNDIQACHSMLRRASVQLDLNGLDTSGLTPLHNAVLEGNLGAVELLVQHGADVNRQDADTWTPLHAACANGEADIARFLLSKGASKDIKTADGERPLDLCDARDFAVISVMLESETSRLARILSVPDEDDEESGDESSDSYSDDNDGQERKGRIIANKIKSSPIFNRTSSAAFQSSQNNKLSSHSAVKTEDASTRSVTKGMNKLKTEDSNGSKSPRNMSTSQLSPKQPRRATPASPSSYRSTTKPNSTDSSVSPTRKSPASTPKFSKNPSRSSPGTPRKSPSHSPGSLRKSPIDHNSGSVSTPTIALSRGSRSSSNTNRTDNNDSAGDISCTKSQATTSRTPKPPGHSILKKTSPQHCHAVAE